MLLVNANLNLGTWVLYSLTNMLKFAVLVSYYPTFFFSINEIGYRSLVPLHVNKDLNKHLVIPRVSC